MPLEKILLVGSDQVWSIERLYLKYLKKSGIEADLFGAQNIFYNYYNTSLISKLVFRAGLSSIHEKIGKMLLAKVIQSKPQVVWVFKGMELSPAILREVKNFGCKLVNYNPDNPFLFTGKGSGNSNITNSISLYDLHFSYSKEIQEKLQSDYHARTAYLPFGYDVSDEVFNECQHQQEIVRCCFLGNPDKTRAAFIQSLAERGLEIDLFGNDWQNFVSHKRIHLHAPVYKSEFWTTLYKYRIQLNIMRIHNLRSHNMRTFEVPGIGGVQLAPDTPEHRCFFADGRDIFLYRNEDECYEKAEYLLSLDNHRVKQIRDSARTRSISSGYSYADRANQALNVMKGIVND